MKFIDYAGFFGVIILVLAFFIIVLLITIMAIQDYREQIGNEKKCFSAYSSGYITYSDYEEGFFGCCIKQYDFNHVRIDDYCITMKRSG